MKVFELVERLDYSSAAWRDDLIATVEKVGLPDLPAVRRHMLGWTAEERDHYCGRSNETPSHYKWLLHEFSAAPVVVWLHEYKEERRRGPGYSQIPHDHRYAFCSIMLAGSFESVAYAPGRPMARLGVTAVRAGEWLSLGHDDIHALDHIADGTHTLVFQGPILRNYSTGYDAATGEPTTFPDFAAKYRQIEV
jgi:hypothetical protein